MLVHVDSKILTIAFLVACPASGWSEDAASIVKRMIDAQNRNAKSAEQYTFVEETDRYYFDKAGQLQKASSETNEVLFVEGVHYRKLIARNEKPLEARDRAKEEKKLLLFAAAQRKERSSGVFHRTVSLGSSEEVLQMFDLRYLGKEEVRGRNTWVVDCAPQADRTPANQHEKEVLSWRMKYWIDEVDGVPIRQVNTVVGGHIAFKPGSTLTTEYRKINDDAWLAEAMTLDFEAQFNKIIKARGRTQYRYSKFQKFDVQSTITLETPK